MTWHGTVVGLALLLIGMTSPLRVAEHLDRAITQIHMTGPAQHWGSCTAFAVRGDWGITAEHCVTSPNGFRYTVYDLNHVPLQVIAVANPNDDLALLKGEIFTRREPLTPLTTNPAQGQMVYASGFAKGYMPSFFLNMMVAIVALTTCLSGFFYVVKWTDKATSMEDGE